MASEYEHINAVYEKDEHYVTTRIYAGIYDPRCPGGQPNPGPPHPSQTTVPQTPAYTGTRPYFTTKPAADKSAKKGGAAPELPYAFEHFGTCSACDEQTYCAAGYGRNAYLCASCDAKMRGVK